MSKDSDTGYWSKLILQIRSSMILSQEQFAEAVFSNQATISRWEKGLVIPSIDKQKLIEKIAEESGLSSLNGIAEVVRESPYQMILFDRTYKILAASISSGFECEKTIREQLPESDFPNYDASQTEIEASSFWKDSGSRFDYSFIRNQLTYGVILTSVIVRGSIYAVAQQYVK